MKSRKIYESPLIEYTILQEQDVLQTSVGDDFGDWGNTNWGLTGGNS